MCHMIKAVDLLFLRQSQFAFKHSLTNGKNLIEIGIFLSVDNSGIFQFHVHKDRLLVVIRQLICPSWEALFAWR